MVRHIVLSRAKSIEGITLFQPIQQKDLIFNKKVFDFLGKNLKKYIKEIIKRNKYVKENLAPIKIEKKPILINKKIDWTDDKDKKLKMLFKKNLPEAALARIFKTTIKEIRSRISTFI